MLWSLHENTNYLLVRPTIRWNGHEWRMGPRHISHANLLRLVQNGDYIQRSSFRTSTERPRAVKKNIILERRSHLKKLFAKLQADVLKHFEKKVYFSEEGSIYVDLRNLTYVEDLKTSGLLSEKPEVNGEVMFDVRFVVLVK